MVKANVKADGLGINAFLLCSLMRHCFKKGKKKTSRASFLHCQSQLKKASELFLPAVQKSLERKKIVVHFSYHML